MYGVRYGRKVVRMPNVEISINDLVAITCGSDCAIVRNKVLSLSSLPHLDPSRPSLYSPATISIPLGQACLLKAASANLHNCLSASAASLFGVGNSVCCGVPYLFI